MSFPFQLVDVFSRQPYGGNSLPVFPESRGLTSSQMLRITQELRHFEAIFLEPTSQPQTVRARVFDQIEELPFAGHPLLGASAVLHAHSGRKEQMTWSFDLLTRQVRITTEVTREGYFGWLDQGEPEFFGETLNRKELANAFSLALEDLAPGLTLEVVSTGLRYLIVPVAPGTLARACIKKDITPLLQRVKAQFAVLWDEAAGEARHWNNDGVVEDVATGSAAGTIGAYRLRHGLAEGNTAFIIHQGRFTGRPSLLHVLPEGTPRNPGKVKVGGDVALLGQGTLGVLP